MHRFVVISGCSSGGKTTLVDALAQAGYAVVPEPGRRIVAQERAGNGAALPWVDARAFARRALDMAQQDLQRAANLPPPVFFDRGLVDAAAALSVAGGPGLLQSLPHGFPYDGPVFLAPPWADIYVQDAARRHSFAEAEVEYARLIRAYGQLGVPVQILPKVSVAARVAWIVQALNLR